MAEVADLTALPLGLIIFDQHLVIPKGIKIAFDKHFSIGFTFALSLILFDLLCIFILHDQTCQ